VDINALLSVGIKPPAFEDIEDTLVAHHCLASNEPHDLKTSAFKYLGIDDDDEDELKVETEKAQRIARKLGWAVIRDKVKGVKWRHPHFPTASKTSWKQDMWVLRALAKHFNYPKDHKWWGLVKRYGMNDSIRAMGIWMVFREALTTEGLWPQYRTRMQVLVPMYAMEGCGMTVNDRKLAATRKDFKRKKADKLAALQAEAPTVENFGSSPQVTKLLYEDWGVPVVHTSKKTGKPSINKDAITKLEAILHHESREYKFIQDLKAYRKLLNAINFCDMYERGGHTSDLFPGFRRIHTNINLTGPRTTRISTDNPPQQNVSKQEAYNLRAVYGPTPGREWYSVDQSNVEMRLFAYCSGDKRLIKAFEDGYAVHLIFAEILYPKEFARCIRDGVSFKERFESTLYQWIKNGNFAIIYGAAEAKADATYRLPGAYRTIRKQLPLVDKFISRMYEQGLQHGYVTLLGGYRLEVPRSDPHKAANYFIQGSAAWAMQVAMLRVWEYLLSINHCQTVWELLDKAVNDPLTWKMILQIHDELDFDFPKLANPTVNLRHIRHIAKLMEKSGDDFSIPLPVEIKRHPVSWAQAEKVAA
jgi:DNA polymerase-1